MRGPEECRGPWTSGGSGIIHEICEHVISSRAVLKEKDVEFCIVLIHTRGLSPSFSKHAGSRPDLLCPFHCRRPHVASKIYTRGRRRNMEAGMDRRRENSMLSAGICTCDSGLCVCLWWRAHAHLCVNTRLYELQLLYSNRAGNGIGFGFRIWIRKCGPPAEI